MNILLQPNSSSPLIYSDRYKTQSSAGGFFGNCCYDSQQVFIGPGAGGLGSAGLVYRFIINLSKIYSWPADADNDVGKIFPINNRDCQLISWGPI